MNLRETIYQAERHAFHLLKVAPELRNQRRGYHLSIVARVHADLMESIRRTLQVVEAHAGLNVEALEALQGAMREAADFLEQGKVKKARKRAFRKDPFPF